MNKNEAALLLAIFGREASDIDKKMYALNHKKFMSDKEMSHLREFPSVDQAIDYFENGTEWHGELMIV